MINYKIIDLDSFPRKDHLAYFLAMNHPHIDMTAMVDVTDLLEFCKKQNCSFYLTVLHIIALAADEVPQLRQRIHRLTSEELMMSEGCAKLEEGLFKGIEIREYEECPTSSTESAGDGLYCYCEIFHHKPWEEYIRTAREKQLQARSREGLEEDEEIEAFQFASCVPWIHFTQTANPTEGSYDSNPRLIWGKYEPDYRGRMMMPLSVTVHHGLVDGIHLARFYEKVDEKISALIEGKLL